MADPLISSYNLVSQWWVSLVVLSVLKIMRLQFVALSSKPREYKQSRDSTGMAKSTSYLQLLVGKESRSPKVMDIPNISSLTTNYLRVSPSKIISVFACQCCENVKAIYRSLSYSLVVSQVAPLLRNRLHNFLFLNTQNIARGQWQCTRNCTWNSLQVLTVIVTIMNNWISCFVALQDFQWNIVRIAPHLHGPP